MSAAPDLVRRLIDEPRPDRWESQRAALGRAAQRLSYEALAEQFRTPTRPVSQTLEEE